MSRRRVVVSILGALAVSTGLGACGSEEVSVPETDANVRAGAEVFAQRCSGCHTLSAAGTQGSAVEGKIRQAERTDGPNFNARTESREQVLYAIRNGGFSGAIMPENIVVGRDAENVAAFVARYAGRGGD